MPCRPIYRPTTTYCLVCIQYSGSLMPLYDTPLPACSTLNQKQPDVALVAVGADCCTLMTNMVLPYGMHTPYGIEVSMD